MDGRAARVIDPQPVPAVTADDVPHARPKASFASRLFGYDIFLSFALGPAPRGALSYASDLARHLRERDFSVFFSEQEAPPGEQLDSVLRVALHRSKTLVVIANRGTLREPRWVRKEVEVFRQYHPARPVVIINVDRALQDPALRESAQEWLDYQDRIWLDESADAVAMGIASGSLVERLSMAPTRLKSNVKWRWAVRTIIVTLAALAIGLGYATKVARDKTKEAIQQRNEANRRRLVSIAQALAAYAPREQTLGRSDELAALLARQAFLFNARAKGERLDQVDSALRQVLATPAFSVALATGMVSKVTFVALSNNGNLVAIGGDGSQVQVWNLRKQEAPRILTHQYGRIIALGFSPTADKLIAATQDGYAIVWDTGKSGAAPTAVRLPPAGSPGFISAAVSADGTQVAYGGRDSRIEVWNLEKLEAGPTILCCHDQASKIYSLAFHPTRDNIIASGGSDNSVRIWDAAHPSSPLKILPGHDNAVTSVQFSPDGRTIASGTERGLVWQGGDLTSLFEDNPKGPGMHGGTVYLWDLNGRVIRKFSGAGGNVTSLAFQPSGDILASAGGGDETVRLWSLSARQQHPIVLSGHKGLVAALAFTPDGETLISVGESDSSVRLWDLRPPAGAAIVLGQEGAIRSLAFTPASDLLASADGSDGKVRVWDLGKRRVKIFLEQTGSAVAVACSPRGNLVAASSERGPLESHPGNSVLLWNRENPNKPLAELKDFQSPVGALSFSADGSLLATAAKLDKRLFVWDVRQPAAAKTTLPADLDNVFSAAFSREGQKLAWSGSDKKVRVADLTQPTQAPLVLNGEGSSINAVAFGPGAELLAAGGDAGTVGLWDLRQPNKMTVKSTGSKQEIFAVAIDSLGHFLAAGGADGRIRVWDLTGASPDPLVFEGPEKPVYSIAFSPDGRWLAAGGSNKGVFVWPSTNVLQELVCQKVRRNLTKLEWQQFVGADVPYERTCDGIPEP